MICLNNLVIKTLSLKSKGEENRSMMGLNFHI
jgi:hypothetical protein